LFRPSWQKEGATHNGEHHGVGLSLAAEFASLLGGDISAELIKEGAVAFTLCLPPNASDNFSEST